nr:glycosyltransferase [Desulfobaculum xiamenense]
MSIVIPSYNMERWLPVALESCLAQTETDIEVIVVDDGSTDRTGEIADAYAAADARVRVIHQENKGLGATRQVGQDAAQGEFITWLDADDFLERNAARDMLGVAERDKVDMVCGNAVVFSEKTFNTRRYFYHHAVSRTTFDNPEYWKSKVLWRWFFRLSFVRRIGMQHPTLKLGQDVCSMYEALTQVDAFSQCPNFFYYFRQDHKRPGSDIEREINHQLEHYREVKRILLAAGRVKPLMKYLLENYFRDIKSLAPRFVGEDAHWRARCVEISLDIFDGLDPAWFRDEFLAPELKSRPEFIPLADALIARDAQAIDVELDRWREAGAKVRDVDKTSAFHTLRRRLKSALKPMSLGARIRLRALEGRAHKRLGPLWNI